MSTRLTLCAILIAFPFVAASGLSQEPKRTKQGPEVKTATITAVFAEPRRSAPKVGVPAPEKDDAGVGKQLTELHLTLELPEGAEFWLCEIWSATDPTLYRSHTPGRVFGAGLLKRPLTPVGKDPAAAREKLVSDIIRDLRMRLVIDGVVFTGAPDAEAQPTLNGRGDLEAPLSLRKLTRGLPTTREKLIGELSSSLVVMEKRHAEVQNRVFNEENKGGEACHGCGAKGYTSVTSVQRLGNGLFQITGVRCAVCGGSGIGRRDISPQLPAWKMQAEVMGAIIFEVESSVKGLKEAVLDRRVKELIARLKVSNTALRKEAAALLGGMGADARDALPPLKEAASDKDQGVARAAADAVSRIEIALKKAK